MIWRIYRYLLEIVQQMFLSLLYSLMKTSKPYYKDMKVQQRRTRSRHPMRLLFHTWTSWLIQTRKKFDKKQPKDLQPLKSTQESYYTTQKSLGHTHPRCRKRSQVARFKYRKKHIKVHMSSDTRINISPTLLFLFICKDKL